MSLWNTESSYVLILQAVVRFRAYYVSKYVKNTSLEIGTARDRRNVHSLSFS